MIFEKVNPAHPDKIADRIAGAITDLAYIKKDNAIIATEVLIGHGECNIISETNVNLDESDVANIVYRIAGEGIVVRYKEIAQDEHLSENQQDMIRCGDNGIFKGVPTDKTEQVLTDIAALLYKKFGSDGKYIIDDNASNGFDFKKLIICQSHATNEEILNIIKKMPFSFEKVIINPLGEWTGGTNVDCGATNRKLGSDMGRAVTGGGLCGKDLSKSDVSLNIYAHLKSKQTHCETNISCAIGDAFVDAKSYEDIVSQAKDYVLSIGGFEKFAEWGLIRPSKLYKLWKNLD